MAKALLVVERTNDVTHPDIAVPLQTFLAPCLPKTREAFAEPRL